MKLDDRSVLSGGALPDSSVYQVVGRADAPRVTAIRVEALADSHLPHASCGRSEEGDFVLTEFEVEVVSSDVDLPGPVRKEAGGDDASSKPAAAPGSVAFDLAYADLAMEHYEIGAAIDGKQTTGWSIAAHEPANRVDHEAVFVPKKPIELPPNSRLVVTLKQESNRRQHLLGRFRISISTAPTDAHRAWGALPSSARALLAIDADDRTAPQDSELAKSYRSIEPTLNPMRAEVEGLHKQEPKDVASTLVLETVKEPRTTHILIRGSHLNPGDPVEPGSPSVLHPWPSGQPINRLGFARWLVDPANPLVGRVTMNRIWAQYFGRGLVETSEDFGAQGELPTHPELLDWLATEFVRQGWSLKAMHRIIATSATYRQAAAASTELLERDPFNRLLARGPRFRMEAEMLRDSALAIGGLLTEKIGGPSVFPHQPDGVWSSPYNGDRWALSKNGDQFRRGLYTFWRRTAPYASFSVFDAPSREVMCERRARSNTPVQALVTLNDPAFVAAANGLAGRLVAQANNSVQDRIAYAFECCTARHPGTDELRPLQRLYEQCLERFNKDPEAAKRLVKVGLPAGEGEDGCAERAAWTVIANVLLNLDEVLTKG